MAVRERLRASGFRWMQGLGFGFQGVGIEVESLGFRVQALGLRLQGLWFKLRVQGEGGWPGLVCIFFRGVKQLGVLGFFCPLLI